MNKKLKAVIVLSFLFTTSFLVFIPTTSSAASPTSYVTITLKNSQSTATPENFTQLINVNWSAYANDLNSNISNVRFYNSTSFSSSTELSGWIENNNITTATSSDVWVNLSDTIIPANGSVSIYMAFLPTTTSWSSHWGLAPQLSTKYGQFDNGKNVFQFYCNFAGTTLNSEWTTGGDYSGSVDNSLNLTSSGDSGGLFTPYSVKSGIIEVRWKQTSYQTFKLIFLNTPNIGTTWYSNGYSSKQYATQSGNLLEKEVQGTNTVLTSTSTVYTEGNIYYIIGLDWNSATGLLNETINYNSISSATDTTFSSMSDIALMAWMGANNVGATNIITWIRMREYPPGDVMPSVTFGSLTKVSTSGHQISFQQTSLPSGTKWGIRLNNTSKVIWQNSTTQYDNITDLSGNYTFQVINATGYASNPYTGVLDVSTANLTQSIIFTGYKITYNETGLPSGDTWYVNLTDQPGLSESSTGQKISGTTASLTNYEPNDTYTFTYQTSDKRYKGGSESFTINGASITENVTFSAVLYYLNFTQLSKPKSVEWGVNVSGTVKTGYGNFSYHLTNGTYFWNASAINGSFDNPIGWWRLTNGSGTVLLHNESSFKGIKIVINGKNYNDNVTFNRAYNITFDEVGIANTFQWDVNLSNGLGSTTDKHIIISDNTTQVYFVSTEGNYTNGSYSGTIETLIYGVTNTRYINFTSKSISEVVSGKQLTIVYNFVTQYYLTTSSLPTQGGFHTPSSGWYNSSSIVQLTATTNSSFQFTGFQGTGKSSYTGMGYYQSGKYVATIKMTNPITEVMDFSNYIVLTFYIQNLTTGTKWGVKLYDGNGLIQWDNSTQDYIVFDISQGSYTYYVTGIKSTPQQDIITVSIDKEIFLQYINTTYDVNFQELGLVIGTSWNVNVFNNITTIDIQQTSSIINFELPNGTYQYTSSTVYGYVSNGTNGKFTVSGNSLLIYVNWTQGNLLILQNIKYFVPIYLNTTGFTIPSGVQMSINVDWDKYHSYENNNLSNVLFMNNVFEPMYAWIENNATSNATQSIVWVKLNTALNGSTNIIYLVFQPNSVNNFNKFGYLGEASQLSKIYGIYDNIAKVMNKGLAYQFYYPYVNYGLNNSDMNSLDNITMTQNSAIYSVFNATTNYEYTASKGVTSSVYYTTYNASSESTMLENNVLFTYGLGPLNDTFPNPPIEFNMNTAFMGKMVGFVVNNEANSFYSIPDNIMQIWLYGNNTNPWTNITGMKEVMDAYQGRFSTVHSANVFQGVSRIMLAYAQGTLSTSSPNPGSEGEANMNLWSSGPASFYSPTPLLQLPTISFGQIESSYGSFYEYGLPTGTNWSLAISGPGFSKLYTSNSNLIYTYLPNGTYIYTIGSVVNGSYHSGVVNVGTTHYVPNPSNGHVIVTGSAFTVQYVIFAKNDLLEYDLIPGQAQYSNGSLILPIFVLNQNNQPANTTVIKDIWQNMSLTYLARLQNQTEIIPFTFSTSGLGMFAIFFSLNVREVKQIKSSNATLSMVSDFSKTAYYTGIATGIAGSASFVDVVVNGQNISSVSPPGVSNTTTNTTGVPWYIGLIANTYPTYSPNALIYLENIVIWILANAGGRALTLIVGLATLLYFAWIINKARKDKGDKKWKFRVEKKLDVVYRKILREPIKQKSNNETSES